MPSLSLGKVRVLCGVLCVVCFVRCAVCCMGCVAWCAMRCVVLSKWCIAWNCVLCGAHVPSLSLGEVRVLCRVLFGVWCVLHGACMMSCVLRGVHHIVLCAWFVLCRVCGVSCCVVCCGELRVARRTRASTLSWRGMYVVCCALCCVWCVVCGVWCVVGGGWWVMGGALFERILPHTFSCMMHGT